jgi:hypothetical protein
VSHASPQAVNRLVCYCDDCQAYVHQLGRADLLDAHGGTDIVQVAPASLSFHRGGERVVGMRLSEKGLYRWHTSCCNAPVGNTLGPGVPFVGIVARAFSDDARALDDLFGPPSGAILGKYAVGGPPEGAGKLNVRMLARVARMVLGWKLGGRTWPHPFFDRATRAPTHAITTLSREEREALRPLCGPTGAPRESARASSS